MAEFANESSVHLFYSIAHSNQVTAIRASLARIPKLTYFGSQYTRSN